MNVKKRHIDIDKYSRDHHFYGDIKCVVTIKSFDLQAIRKRYLASKKNNKTGSVERRKVAEGGLAYVHMKDGKLLEFTILKKCKEPRGIDYRQKILSYSSESEIIILNDDIRSLKNPWFSYIHTVSISPDLKSILVSSSGFDVVFEYDLNSLDLKKDWWAWENGFHVGTDPKDGSPVIVSREKLSEDVLKGTRNLVIQDPTTDSLPTAMRTAFINSVSYNEKNPSKWLATFFHEGAVYEIDSTDGSSQKVIQGMTNPHGGQKIDSGFMATDTRGGAVIIREDDIETRYGFENLPGKPSELEDGEWIQNSKYIKGDIILSIDSNRNSFVIFDPHTEKIDLIPFDNNLAVQDLVFLSEISDEEVAKIKDRMILNHPAD